MMPNTGMPVYGNNFTNQTTGYMNTNMNTTGGCGCGNNTTPFNNPQNNNQGLNNFFVPFPYGRE